MPAGRFITFEGGDGTGKTTQIVMLADFLETKGISCLSTREPGGSPGAEEIRDLVISGDVGRWDAVSEVLLFSAARRDSVNRIIKPALSNGMWVLCDRFIDSTRVYQGYGRGVDFALLDHLEEIVCNGLRPDVTLLLDNDPAIGLARIKSRDESKKEQRFEEMGPLFHERLRQGFLTIAAADPLRVKMIDANATPKHVHEAVLIALGLL